MKTIIDPNAFLPVRAHPTDAGVDLKSPIDITVPAHDSCIIDTGVHFELPENTVGMIKSKSGLNVKHNITSEGVCDEGYSGSVVVKLYNHGDEDYQIHRGDKISQYVVLPVLYETIEQVESFDSSDKYTRGNDGFGSTGK